MKIPFGKLKTNVFSTYIKHTIVSNIYFVIQSKLLKGWENFCMKS
jgi:hypothetical protein